MLTSTPDFYLNLSQLSELKHGARRNSADASQAVAKQFESLFIQQMLAAMRSAAVVDESGHSSYTDFYQEMHDKQLALTIARQGGMGLAKFIMQQMPGGQKPAGNGGQGLPFQRSQGAGVSPSLSRMNYEAENPSVVVNRFVQHDIGTTAARNASGTTPTGQEWRSAKEFVASVWPGASRAASALGVSTGLLVAQSALETGWGKHMMRHADGSPSFNLFGIKAGSDWKGATLTRPTLEYRDGLMKTEVARFRAYASVEDSLADYVDFIRSRQRYQGALDHGGDDTRYLRGIQQAGYATDPDYADKIFNIMQGEQLREGLAYLSLQQDTALNGDHRDA